LNHERLNTSTRNRCGIAFGEAILISSSSSRSQICGQATHQGFAESGVGGWADERTETAGETRLIRRRWGELSPEKPSTTFDNISAKTLQKIVNSVEREAKGKDFILGS
jgi:hypothetical protein